MSIMSPTAQKLIVFKIIKRISLLSQGHVFCVEIPGMFEEENKGEVFKFLLIYTYPSPSIRKLPSVHNSNRNLLLHGYCAPCGRSRFTFCINEYRISIQFSYRCLPVSQRDGNTCLSSLARVLRHDQNPHSEVLGTGYHVF